MNAIDPMIPAPFRILRTRKELDDTFTMDLEAVNGARFPFLPGQFNMLYVHGVGEVPISISGDPADPSKLVHTVRAVGQVTEMMRGLKKGQMVGVRGPFGSDWPVAAGYGKDVIIVAGGIGLAPVRPIIYSVLAERARFGRVLVLYGARTPSDVLYEKELHEWRGRFDMSVHVTVDRAEGDWSGNVGVVTKLIEREHFDPIDSVAYMCGPEVMMRFAGRSLNDKGVTDDNIYVSMERNMKCAVGFCGHCQWGGDFICKDGPVYRFDRIRPKFDVREL